MIGGLALVGYLLVYQSWRAAGWAALFALIAHLMVLTEKEHLRRIFGEEYAAYCKRAPRYL